MIVDHECPLKRSQLRQISDIVLVFKNVGACHRVKASSLS